MTDIKKDKRRHVIKLSPRGVDVGAADAVPREPKTDLKKPTLPHILYGLALPYLYGAQTQVDRYRQAASTLKARPAAGVQACLHEVSCLFEDLVTVSKYAEMCGHTHELHALWLDVRNHIRHDIREEIDDESSARKKARAKRLGLNENLQISISFTEDAIRVGGTHISMSSIEGYLAWAKNVVGDVLGEAQDKGLIKSS